MNLREHHVKGKPGKTFHTPIDLEAHVGTDGRLYLVDFGFVFHPIILIYCLFYCSLICSMVSRLFPPQSPRSPFPGKNKHLYQLFRPEFVASYQKPLCSDAYSYFIAQDDHPEAFEINQDVCSFIKVYMMFFFKKYFSFGYRLRKQQNICVKLLFHVLHQ